MNMGGAQITEGATYAPERTDDPPGTMRTRSATENLGAGNVSLSTKESPAVMSVSWPRRNPSRMPCLIQTLTIQWLLIFSAARILPCVSWSRNSMNVLRASGSCSTSPCAERRSINNFREDMRGKYTGNGEGGNPVSSVKREERFLALRREQQVPPLRLLSLRFGRDDKVS